MNKHNPEHRDIISPETGEVIPSEWLAVTIHANGHDVNGASNNNYVFPDFMTDPDLDTLPPRYRNEVLDQYVVDHESMYMNMMGRFPILTSEEVTTLYEQMAAGEQAKLALPKLIDSPGLFPLEQVAELRAQIAMGIEAKKKLYFHNLRLVVSIAKEHLGWGVPLMDLIQEGNMVLLEIVIPRFETERNLAFSNFATWWIRQRIMLALPNQGQSIRIPKENYELIKKLYWSKYQFFETHDRDATEAELSEIMQIDLLALRDLINWSTNRNLIQLDKPSELTNGSELDRYEFWFEEASQPTNERDLTVLPPLEVTLMNLVEQTPHLSEREKLVLQHRFGLIGVPDGLILKEGQDNPDLIDLAPYFKLSKNQMKDLNNRAMQKFRTAENLKVLEDYKEVWQL